MSLSSYSLRVLWHFIYIYFCPSFFDLILWRAIFALLPKSVLSAIFLCSPQRPPFGRYEEKEREREYNRLAPESDSKHVCARQPVLLTLFHQCKALRAPLPHTEDSSAECPPKPRPAGAVSGCILTFNGKSSDYDNVKLEIEERQCNQIVSSGRRDVRRSAAYLSAALSQASGVSTAGSASVVRSTVPEYSPLPAVDGTELVCIFTSFSLNAHRSIGDGMVLSSSVKSDCSSQSAWFGDCGWCFWYANGPVSGCVCDCCLGSKLPFLLLERRT